MQKCEKLQVTRPDLLTEQKRRRVVGRLTSASRKYSRIMKGTVASWVIGLLFDSQRETVDNLSKYF